MPSDQTTLERCFMESVAYERTTIAPASREYLLASSPQPAFLTPTMPSVLRRRKPFLLAEGRYDAAGSVGCQADSGCVVRREIEAASAATCGLTAFRSGSLLP